MNLRWLQAYRAVMTLGTITQAAERLHVSQPAVSRMIANLEAELGFKLFVRARGRLVPTSEGELFYGEAERVLAGISEIRDIAQDIRKHEGGRLRIVATSGVANGLLPAALPSFVAENPSVNVSLQLRSNRDVEQWMASKQFDMGLAVLPIHHPAVVCRPFVDADVLAVLPEGHHLAERDEISIADLAAETLITLPSYTVFHRDLSAALAAEGLSPEIHIETSSLYSACRMVAHGVGVCFADRFTVDCVVHERVEVRALRPAWRQTFGFVFPSDQPPSRLTERFAEIVTETAAGLVAREVAGVREA